MLSLPEGEWRTAFTGVRNCACHLKDLEPFRDYRFRIRVENKYGVSDPSPYLQTYRYYIINPYICHKYEFSFFLS